MSESRDTGRFPTQDQRTSVSSLIRLAMLGARVLQLEQNNCGYACDVWHCCRPRSSNICGVSATCMMGAWRVQRTCVATALTARVRHHDVNLTACVRQHATHTGACPCCIMILPLTTHAPSRFPSPFPRMSTHPALHDAASVPHVHGRRHTWVRMHLFMSVALLARSPVGSLQPPFLGRHGKLAGGPLMGQLRLAG